MEYFIDTEFNETAVGGMPPTIDLISIAIVDAEGRTYYAESSEFDESLCNEWVVENVLPKLGSKEKRRPRNVIRDEIAEFVSDDSPEFWAYYADYDWVVFCWIWGAMVDLPKHFPMMCMDLQQWWIQLGKPLKPSGPSNAHSALDDARWNKEFHNHLSIEAERGTNG